MPTRQDWLNYCMMALEAASTWWLDCEPTDWLEMLP